MCTGSDPLEKYSIIRQVFQVLLLLGNMLGLVVILLLSVYLSDKGGFGWDTISGSINLHILFMSIFLVCLQADASLVYRIVPTAPKYTSKIVHATFHGISIVGMSIALAATINHHNLAKLPHFYTLHSWIGILTISFYSLQFIVGLCTFFLPQISLECKIAVLPCHKFIGKSLFICTLGTALTGLMQKGSSLGPSYSLLNEAAMELNFAAFIITIFGVIMVYLIGNHAFRRRPRAELEPLLSTTHPSTSQGLGTTITKTYTIYR